MRSSVKFIKSLSCRGLLLAACVALTSPAGRSQVDPDALQRRGIERIDRFIEHYRKTGDFESLLPELRQAEKELASGYELFLGRGALAPAALSLIKLGTAQRLQQRWAPAKATFQQAHDLARKADHVSYQMRALTGLATVEMNGLRDYEAAAAHVEEVIRLGSQGGDKQALFDALDLKSIIQEGRGELIAAAETNSRAHAVASEMNDLVSLYFAFLSRAGIHQRLGGTCDAKRGFEPCHEALDRAQSDYEQALSITRKLEYHHLSKEMAGFLNRVEMRRKMLGMEKRDWAREYRAFNPTRPGQVLVNEQFIARGQSFPPGSEQLLQEVIRKYTGDAVGYHTEGLLWLLQGQDDAASKAFLKAVELLEADRRSLRDGTLRGTFLEDKIEIYYYPMLDLLDRRRFPEAFDLMERSKSRAMADLLRSQELKLTNPAERKFYADSVSIDANISRLQKDLFNLRNASDRGGDAGRIARIGTEIRRLEEEHGRLLKSIPSEGSELRELVAPETASLSQLQQAMGRDRFEVLYYLVLKDQIVLWHISRDAVHARAVFLPRPVLTRKVTSLRQSLSDPNVKFDQQTAREMFLFLIQPALQWIKTDHLVIIPHDELNYVPFQVFQNPSDNRYLGESFRISYTPNATNLLQLKKTQSIRGGRLLAVADPDIVDAQDEVQSIGKLYPGRSKIISDVLAGEADIKSQAGNYNLVHLSVHGKFNPQEPLLSHLKLSRGGADDGMLTAAEMFGLPLAPNSLVVLSACDTGQAQATRANEILGMVRALLYAGANSMVLSSWQVDAASTALWMETFYREAQSKPLNEAAHLALIKVKQDPRYIHPYYWSPFLLIAR